MPTKEPDGRIERFALAIATGTHTVRTWSDENGVALRTCYNWHERPKVKARIKRIRRDYASKTLGLLVVASNKATLTLESIGDDVEAKDSDRVAASRALLSHWTEVRKADDLDARMAAIEAELKIRKGRA